MLILKSKRYTYYPDFVIATTNILFVYYNKIINSGTLNVTER